MPRRTRSFRPVLRRSPIASAFICVEPSAMSKVRLSPIARSCPGRPRRLAGIAVVGHVRAAVAAEVAELQAEDVFLGQIGPALEAGVVGDIVRLGVGRFRRGGFRRVGRFRALQQALDPRARVVDDDDVGQPVAVHVGEAQVVRVPVELVHLHPGEAERFLRRLVSPEARSENPPRHNAAKTRRTAGGFRIVPRSSFIANAQRSVVGQSPAIVTICELASYDIRPP